MPYEPGVQPIGGQLIGQGLASFGAGIGQAVKAYQQNKLMASQAIAKFEGAARSDPSILQFLQSPNAPQDVASKFQKLGKDGTLPLKDAALLAQFTDTYIKGKSDQMDQQMKQAQYAQFLQNQQRQAKQDALVQQYQNINAGHSSMYNNATMQAAQSPMGQAARGVVQATGALPTPGEMLDYQSKVQQLGAKPSGEVTFRSMAELSKAYPSEKWDYSIAGQNPDGSVTVKGLSPRAPVVPQLEIGYEPDPDHPGTVRPQTGSAAERAIKAAEETRNAQQRDALDNATVVLDNLSRVMPKISGMTAGAGGTILGAIPGTEAKDTAMLIDTIKGQIGFDRLQNMRTNSKSGASGLGQLSAREMDFLQALQGNLSTQQSPAQLAETLGKIKDHFDRFKMTLEGKNPDEAATGKPPAGVDAALWNVMTPQERALFSK